MNMFTGTPDPYDDVPPPEEETVAPLPGNDGKQGNAPLPVSHPLCGKPGNAPYVDIASLLDGGLSEPPAPHVLARSDGISLFYAGQVNWVFGDPEGGKTWICAAAAVEQLNHGHRVVWVDLDHNGPDAIVSRLMQMGASPDALRDLDRFRFIEPDDRATLRQVVEDAVTWKPAVIVVDSIGELLPMFGVSSNSPDDFTTVHAHVLKPLAKTGAAVIAVDHLAKNTDSRNSGPGGTAAKRRTIGGTSIRVTVKEAFTPGHGGAAHLAVNKDRHGGLRAHCPTGDREPYAGTFVLTTVDDDCLDWRIAAPGADTRNPDEQAPADDVAALASLDPPPSGVRDAAARMSWRTDRAGAALKSLRAQPNPPLPVTDTGGGKRVTTPERAVWLVSGEPVDGGR